ncbi:protein Largen-like [Scyliorhinus canicula]|uniref:protein Largen-like n=1 Tax=Scyliorhinus canicula TaxID=7830 RepID=UPI0018F4FF14|nr:protein Largen-like [Scyliorhinus canicula]XP_038632834.1 protein Largen-like [Scyliorhinus canicula]XP_038632835.1 protein Largen-like [Scyliorhinus canicula]
MSEKASWAGEDLKIQDSQSKVKEQIMCIVKDLELVLGELKTVSTEMKEVVGQIDQLTTNLNLCEDVSKNYKCDTLDSSSSGVTMSTLEKSKDRPKVISRTLPTSTTVLTVLRKSKPPPPPPRRTPVRVMSPAKAFCINNNHKISGTLTHNGTHSPTYQLVGGSARCSPNIDTPTWVQGNPTEDAGHAAPMANTIQFGQQPSKCSLYPTYTTRHELPVEQQDVCTAHVHCYCTRSGLHPCLHRRTPIFCNSSTSTTNVSTKSHPKNPQATVRKPTSTTV